MHANYLHCLYIVHNVGLYNYNIATIAETNTTNTLVLLYQSYVNCVCCVYFSHCHYIVYIAYFELPTVMDMLLPQRLFLHGIDDF